VDKVHDMYNPPRYLDILFYVLFTVHFDNIQQLNQKMHFIS
jgi:hypothetical protein